MKLFNKITIFGLGYIGLPTAAMFAKNNKKVVGVDVNKDVIKTINAGKIHIIEPELEQLVREVVNNKSLIATSQVEESDVFIIAVPTPFLPLKKGEHIPKPDLTYIKSVTKDISKVLKKGDLIPKP